MSHDLSRPFGDHLAELRRRLLIVFSCFLAFSLIGYLIHPRILDVFLKPLAGPVFYTSPAGGFDFVVKISLFFGLIVTIPILTYQTLGFLSPVLPHAISRRLAWSLLASCLLLTLGVTFAYFVSLPAALYFLGSFSSSQVRSLITSGEYLSFITRYLLGFGLLFQLPLILWAVNSVVTLSTKRLMGYQRWVILLSFIAAAILTPTPDVFNQLLMAIPIILLYQISVILLWWLNR